jgi:hypothetical protein
MDRLKVAAKCATVRNKTVANSTIHVNAGHRIRRAAEPILRPTFSKVYVELYREHCVLRRSWSRLTGTHPRRTGNRQGAANVDVGEAS